jgi:3-phosphoshikimate 1-carboxyvinyltransferase
VTVVGGPGGAEEVVAVRPAAGPLDAVVHVPGSKSLTNRALVAAALAPGRSWVRGALFADDTEAMLAALTALGITVSTDPEAGTVAVDGTGGDLGVGAASIDARMSGTTSRFVLPMLALGTGVHRLDGAPSLRARPFGHQLAALRTLGASVRELGRPGRLPVEVSGGTVRGGRLELPGDTSSQFASGLLLTAPLLDHGLELRLTGKLVSRPYLRLTVDVMTAFGATVDHDGDRTWTVAPSGYRPTGYDVEADASAASYFFAAAAVCGGRVRVQGLGRDSHQGDLAFVDVLEAMGAQVDRGATATSVIGSGELRGIDVDLADLSDTAQTLAAVAVFASGPTRVRGVGFTRAKETDRVAAVVTELRRLGIDATEHEDGFEVHPGTPRSGRVRTYGDHRMAMSFAVIGLGAPGVEICDPGCVAKTFPAFWDVLAGLDGPNTAGPGRPVGAG